MGRPRPRPRRRRRLRRPPRPRRLVRRGGRGGGGLGGGGGPVGPGAPAVAVEVPLWVALQLRRADRCQVRAPAWMRPEFLAAQLERERADDRSLAGGYPYR